MKIVIIGAGIGGLQTAKALAEGGAEVIVFEGKQRKDMSYDWIDDVETKVFEELGIPLPDGFFHTADVTFAAPFSSKRLHVYVDEEKRDWSIERRPFTEILISRAIKAGAEIKFETMVERLMLADGKVYGVVVAGEEIKADLVVDASGVTSKFRKEIPKKFGIQEQPSSGEVFRAYRAFFTSKEGVERPVDDKLIYLKHLGEDGISWCFVEPNGDVNVLIGRIDNLTEETKNNALNELRKDNPIIGDKLLRGDMTCTIPIRYPITGMVADGYVVVGDSAFMTIPMIGSGIANSLRAGQILADVVLKAKSCDVKTLWEYQYRYYRNIGAGHVSVDMIKRMLLSANGNDIRFLFEKGVLSETELQGIASGEKLKMSFAMVLDKVKRGWKKLGLLIKVAKTIGKGEKAEAFAYEIPETYDKSTVAKWQRTLDAYFRN